MQKQYNCAIKMTQLFMCEDMKENVCRVYNLIILSCQAPWRLFRVMTSHLNDI